MWRMRSIADSCWTLRRPAAAEISKPHSASMARCARIRAGQGLPAGLKPRPGGARSHAMANDPDAYPRTRMAMRLAFVVFYTAAGVLHLRSPDAFLPIVPLWVPFPREVVLATGVCEFAGAAGLLVPRLRRLAGIMLALYAVCVFPANIRHAVEGIQVPGLPTQWWYHAPRLALQPVLVWASLFCAGVIDWPFRPRRSGLNSMRASASGVISAPPSAGERSAGRSSSAPSAAVRDPAPGDRRRSAMQPGTATDPREGA